MDVLERCVDEELAELVMCPICKDVCKDASILHCGHFFCDSCLGGPTGICPVCRRSFFTRGDGRIVNQMVSKLRVRCENEGCDDIFAIEHQEHHECKFEPIMCRNRACCVVVLRREMKKHKRVCEHAEVPCGLCGEHIRKSGMDDHLKEECPKRKIACECGNEMDACELDDHQRSCEDVRVGCVVRGCGKTMKRKRVGRHMDKSTKRHVELLLEEVDFVTNLLANERGNIGMMFDGVNVCKMKFPTNLSCDSKIGILDERRFPFRLSFEQQSLCVFMVTVRIETTTVEEVSIVVDSLRTMLFRFPSDDNTAIFRSSFTFPDYYFESSSPNFGFTCEVRFSMDWS